MRVALVGPVYPYRGGIAHYTTKLYQALRNLGHEVLVVSFKRQYPRWLFPGRTDRDPSAESPRVPDAKYWIDSLNPVSWMRTAWRIKRSEPDVVVMQWWVTFWAPVWLVLAWVVRTWTQSSLVFVCHNVLPHEERMWDRWVARSVLSHGTHFIVQSVEEDRRLHELLPKANATVVPLPVFDLFPDYPLSKAEARAALGVALDGPMLLFFGIVREYKGLMDLLEAMPEVRARFGNVQLYIAGEFWDSRERTIERITELGIQDSVRIEDRYIPNEEVYLFFRAADVVVAPHRRATGSGVVQMAIGFGVPLVTTLGSLFEGLQLPKCFRVVPPNDSPALARAVADLLTVPRSESHAIEIQRLHDAFSWERLVRTLEHIAPGVA